MPALVPELVNMASDPAVSTADLLRRALVVARRLAVPELVDWLSQEMNGYEDRESIPEYRTMWGQLQVLEPVTGAHIPFLIQNAEKDELVRCHREGQPISVLESIAAGEGEIVKFFPTTIEQKLMGSMRVRMRPRLVLSDAQVRGIVDGARNKILEWALDLEGRGIIGEGMSVFISVRSCGDGHASCQMGGVPAESHCPPTTPWCTLANVRACQLSRSLAQH